MTSYGDDWTWHRTTPSGKHEVKTTTSLTPPKGKGWTLQPSQGPAIGEVPGIDSLTPARNSTGTKSRRPKEDRSFA